MIIHGTRTRENTQASTRTQTHTHTHTHTCVPTGGSIVPWSWRSSKSRETYPVGYIPPVTSFLPLLWRRHDEASPCPPGSRPGPQNEDLVAPSRHNHTKIQKQTTRRQQRRRMSRNCTNAPAAKQQGRDEYKSDRVQLLLLPSCPRIL